MKVDVRRAGAIVGASLLVFVISCKRPVKPVDSAMAQPTNTAAPGGTAKSQVVNMMVPFVGCPADGQLGPQPAPTGAPKQFTLTQELGGQVAYYQGPDGAGVLAPKGWSCILQVGSDGEVLYVNPNPIGASQLFGDDKSWKGFTGPAIELSAGLGETSGRYQVAKLIARVFPQRMAFVRGVINGDMGYSETDFPTGSYPGDHYTYKTPDMVEFVTPPNTKGLGTDSQLLPNDQLIEGVASVSGDGVNVDSEELIMRLPPGQQALVPVILKQVETDATPQQNK